MATTRGGQMMVLRFVVIPADRSVPVSERSLKVENLRLSCDAAYFIPALLKDGPHGFSNANNLNMVLPFPTFNECQRENVPLFFFKRSESRDKQENCRAKFLLDVFNDKLSKRQNTFYGDVLVFWRKSVDETRHQMKLMDFTLSDITRFIGAKVNPIEASTDYQSLGETVDMSHDPSSGSPQQQPLQPQQQPYLLHGENVSPQASTSVLSSSSSATAKGVSQPTVDNVPTQPAVGSSNSSSTSSSSSSYEGSHKSLGQQQNVKSNCHASEAVRPPSAEDAISHTTQVSSKPDGINVNSQHVEFDLSSSRSPYHSVTALESNKRVDQRRTDIIPDELDGESIVRSNPSCMRRSHSPSLGPQEHQVQQGSRYEFLPTALGSSMPRTHQHLTTTSIDPSIQAMRQFLESLSHQVPVATNALETLVARYDAIMAVVAASGNDQRLLELTDALVGSEVKEGRLQSELLKLSSDVSQITAFNNSLNRQYQSLQDDLLVAQSSAQRYKEDATRMVRDGALLREEIMLLRNRNSLLESELRSTGRILPTDSSPQMATTTMTVPSPTHKATSGSGVTLRKPLHHVKSSSSAGNGAVPSGVQNPGQSLINSSSVTQEQGPQQTSVSPNSPTLSSKWGREPGIMIGAGGSGPAPASSSQSLFPSRHFIVTQVYKPEDSVAQEQFACLTEGEMVTVDREDESGWWWVTNGRPMGSGWYPFSFLRPSPS